MDGVIPAPEPGPQRPGDGGKRRTVAITGGAGYVGSALVPYLLERGYQVSVLDLFWYGRPFPEAPGLRLVEGDIRDPEALDRAFAGADAVLHLACISNDPSFELDPALGRSINLDAFPGVLAAARRAGARRFIYASSSSVYGIREEPDVHEESPCLPLTDYSRYKLECEAILHQQGFEEYVILRPATVCGWAPRMRLDLTVNILTIHALVLGKIRVFGGSQLRPNLHMRDMVEVYRLLLEAPARAVHGQTFNAGYQNLPVLEIAHKVRSVLGEGIEIEVTPSDDLRSYHISSAKIARVLGFQPAHTVEEAISDIARAYRAGWFREPMTNPLYYNIRRMQELDLSRP